MHANNTLTSRTLCRYYNDPGNNDSYHKRSSMFVALIFPFLVCCTFLILPLQAFAETGTVRVLIEFADFNGCDDFGSPPDIYFVVEIDGETQNTRDSAFESNIHPFAPDIEFIQTVDLADGIIPIVIRQKDKDTGFLGDNDDTCNISPVGNEIDIELDLGDCTISGELSGVCDATIMSTQGVLHFKISLDEPASSADLNVRCIHIPVWPQPGEPVTLIVQALDGEAQLLPIDDMVDNMEIWVDDVTAPLATTLTDDPGAVSFSTVYTPAAGIDQLAYRCRIIDSGTTISSGWRIAQIGPPGYGRAVPILYNGPRDKRIDVLFIPDKDSYIDGADSNFLQDVAVLIQEGFYADTPVYLARQNLLNFWIAMDTGDAVPLGADGKGRHARPANWNKNYAFADTGAIIHTDNFRDYAIRGKRIFSVSMDALDPFPRGAILRHESGHTPFGLSDEYCCDISYFQAIPNPNVYQFQTDCLNDPLADNVADSCQEISDFVCQGGVNDNQICTPDSSSMDVDSCGDGVLCSSLAVDWFRVESQSTFDDDLMVNDKTPQAADKRRINWVFDRCVTNTGDC